MRTKQPLPEERRSRMEELRGRYAEVARKNEPVILRHALRLCGGNLDWASDLTQEAIVAGYSQCLENKLDFDGNVKAWFLRVVTTRFINEFRRNKKWTADVRVETLDESHSASVIIHSEPVDPSVAGLFEEPLEKALRQLPEDQRLCVLLVDVENMSYAEAGELLNIPVGTVRSRLARARLRLYTLLVPYAKSKGIL